MTEYAALASKVGVPESEDVEQQAAAVREWFEHNREWLLIFDNVTNPDSVRLYLPRGGCLAPHGKLRGAIMPTPRQQGSLRIIAGSTSSRAIVSVTNRSRSIPISHSAQFS